MDGSYFSLSLGTLLQTLFQLEGYISLSLGPLDHLHPQNSKHLLYFRIKLVLLAQVLPRPQLIFPSKTWFFGIYVNFQWQKPLKNQYLPHSESKSYQINSIKSCPSNNTKGTFQFLQNYQLPFNLISREEIIQYSKTFAQQVLQMSWNQAHAPLLIKSFPKTPRTRSEASQFGRSHNYKTKQTSFLHR